MVENMVLPRRFRRNARIRIRPGCGRRPAPGARSSSRTVPGSCTACGHERRDVLPVPRGRQPTAFAPAPLLLGDPVPVRGDVDVPEEPDLTVERPMGQAKLEVHPRFAEDAVPLAHPRLDVRDEVVAQPLVEHVEGRRLVHCEAASFALGRAQQGVHGGIEPVVVVDPAFAIASLEPHRVPVRGVRGHLRPEEVEGHRIVEVEVLLKRLGIDDSEGPADPHPVTREALPRSFAPPASGRTRPRTCGRTPP